MSSPKTPGNKVPELLRPSDYAYYTSIPPSPEGWPERDSPKALRKSLDKAHDNLHHVIRENDRLRRALLEQRGRQRWQLKAFWTLMGLTWTALGWVLHLLIPYAVRGMSN